MSNSCHDDERAPQFQALVKKGVLNGASCYSPCILGGKYMLVVVIYGTIHLVQYIQGNAPDFSSISSETVIAGSLSEHGDKDGPGNEATFGLIQAITVVDNEFVLICDVIYGSLRSMKLTPPYIVETVCGNDSASHYNLRQKIFECPIDVCVDEQKNIFVLDKEKSNIYKINSKRDRVCVYYENSMLGKCYHGDACFKAHCYLLGPGRMQILQNQYLVVLNSGANIICKISLPVGKDNLLQISSVFSPSRTINCFGTTKQGVIIACIQSDLNKNVSFYSIKSDKITQLAIKSHERDTEVWDLKIRPADGINPMSFDTIDKFFKHGQRMHIFTTSSNLNMKWELIRILFIACFKPVSKTTKNFKATFSLLPHDGNSNYSSPILTKILHLVTNID